MQVPVPGSGGQFAGVVHVVDVEWLHTLTLAQLPPGFGQARLVYLHFPTVGQSLSLAQVVPVAAQILPCTGHSEVWKQLALLTVQLMLPSDVCVAVAVWVPVPVCVAVAVWVAVEVLVLVHVQVLLLVAVLLVVPVCVAVEVWVPVAVCVVVAVCVPVDVWVAVPV